MPKIANKIIIVLVSFMFLQVGSLYAEVSYTFKVQNTEFIGSIEKEKGEKKNNLVCRNSFCKTTR